METPATRRPADNRALGIAINRDIWNEQRLDLIPEYFTEDFVADYSPRGIRHGHQGVRDMVAAAHSTFADFSETLHQIVADEEHVVAHFTISGIQINAWGPVAPTGRPVRFPEMVIMTVRDGRVCRQQGVSDALLALQQLGAVPDPAGFASRSLADTP